MLARRHISVLADWVTGEIHPLAVDALLKVDARWVTAGIAVDSAGDPRGRGWWLRIRIDRPKVTVLGRFHALKGLGVTDLIGAALVIGAIVVIIMALQSGTTA